MDHLILGGVIYNTYLAAKWGVQIAGVSEKDVLTAKELVALDQKAKKIVELPLVVESETMEEPFEGKFRTVSIKDFKAGDRYGYLLDIASHPLRIPRSKRSFPRPKRSLSMPLWGTPPILPKDQRPWIKASIRIKRPIKCTAEATPSRNSKT